MSRSGQITVLVLLLGLLGLTTALSVASRSLSDLKQVSTVDVGTKAFAAAEAGLEYAFNDFSKNKNTYNCLPQTANLTIPGISNITYTICVNNADYAILTNVSKDDVFQVDLPANNPNNLKTGDVLWSNSSASVEVSVMDNNGSLARYYFNPQGSSLANGFALGQNVTTGCVTTMCSDPSFSSWSGCAPNIDRIGTAKFIRVRPIYNTTSIALCGRTAGGSPGRFPAEFYTITVAATTTNGTVRRIQAVKTPSALPAIFNSVLYTGGNIQK